MAEGNRTLSRIEILFSIALAVLGIGVGAVFSAAPLIAPNFALVMLWAGIALTVASLVGMLCLLSRRGPTSVTKTDQYNPQSAIRTVGYDPQRGQLRLRFSGGEQYAYFGVPDAVHRAFQEAESKGRFFQAQIRDRYPFSKLD